MPDLLLVGALTCGLALLALILLAFALPQPNPNPDRNPCDRCSGTGQVPAPGWATTSWTGCPACRGVGIS